MIDLFCGINETKWNHHPVNPGPLVCIAPVYGATQETKTENAVSIPSHCRVIEDSGAFADGPGDRLSFQQALDRQLQHATKYGYSEQVEALASYDLLIDEKWENGKRHKRRWSENDAELAVSETIEAAEFLVKNYSGKRVLSAQGVTARQYHECARRILHTFNTERDIFGLGGWCISGKMPRQIRPVFSQTMKLVIPLLGKFGVKRVHIWGMTDVTFLGPLLWLCDQHDIKLSTDSSAPQRRPTLGHWGFRGWCATEYKMAPVEIRGIHRAIHVQLMRQRLATLRNSRFYHHPDFPDGATLPMMREVLHVHTA